MKYSPILARLRNDYITKKKIQNIHVTQLLKNYYYKLLKSFQYDYFYLFFIYIYYYLYVFIILYFLFTYRVILRNYHVVMMLSFFSISDNITNYFRKIFYRNYNKIIINYNKKKFKKNSFNNKLSY